MNSASEQKFAHSDAGHTVVCLATYGPRLATLLDTAERFEFFELGPDGDVTPVGRLIHSQTDPAEIPGILAAHGVTHVICGGIGPEYLNALNAGGIAVTPWICGETALITDAICHDRLAEHRMPGCCGRRQGRGMGQGMGQGSGRGMGGGCRRMGGGGMRRSAGNRQGEDES